MESKRIEKTQERLEGKSLKRRRKEGDWKKKKYEWKRKNRREYKVRMGWR